MSRRRPPRVLEGQHLPHWVRELDQERRPERLYLWGQLPRGPCVAVVGTRRASEQGQRYAWELARELAEHGVWIASGGAEGIDIAAHRGALDAGRPTLVVAASGLDKPYPAQHRADYEAIVRSGGGYVTHAPPGTCAQLGQFFDRNAILVALSQAVIFVEAPLRSGTKNTAAHARAMARPLFVVPMSPWHVAGAGNVVELKRGGLPLASYKDVLQLLDGLGLRGVEVARHSALGADAEPPIDAHDARLRERQLELTARAAAAQPVQQREGRPTALESVRAAVKLGAASPDAVVDETGLSSGDVQAALLELSLKGELLVDSAGVVRWLGTRRRG